MEKDAGVVNPKEYSVLIAPVWNRNRSVSEAPRPRMFSVLIAPVWNRNYSMQFVTCSIIIVLIAPVWNRNLSIDYLLET